MADLPPTHRAFQFPVNERPLEPAEKNIQITMLTGPLKGKVIK